jgi:putative nucleotidyltransferase with HDIG domain
LPGSPAHLVTRFFDIAGARPLTASERAAVEKLLTPELSDVFFAQSDPDQRHGYHAAATVLAAGVDRQDVVVAALLHDIGKRHARLGLIGRSVASVLILLRLPLSERMQSYRDHGLIAARELGALGAPSLAIDFAMHHHGPRPPTIDAAEWDVLVSADQAPKPSAGGKPGITSTIT